MLRKGRITNVYEDGTCRVESMDIPGDISAPISVQEGINTEDTPLQKDDAVVYVLFNDQSGMVIGRF